MCRAKRYRMFTHTSMHSSKACNCPFNLPNTVLTLSRRVVSSFPGKVMVFVVLALSSSEPDNETSDGNICDRSGDSDGEMLIHSIISSFPDSSSESITMIESESIMISTSSSSSWSISPVFNPNKTIIFLN